MKIYASLERPQPARHYGARMRELAPVLAGIGIDGLLVVQTMKHMGGWAVGAGVAGLGLEPLIAVSPQSSHPLTAAREAASISGLWDVPVGLNIIAGTGAAEHAAYASPSATRPQQFAEFCDLVAQLIAGRTCSIRGAAYQVEGARLAFSCEMSAPRVWAVVAGASAAAAGAAGSSGLQRAVHASPGHVPLPANVSAVHAGIITRPVAADAWARARSLFPEPNRCEQVPEAAWQAALVNSDTGDDDMFWKEPFLSGSRPYPYLVGSYEAVRRRLRDYAAQGCRQLIVQRTDELEDLEHLAQVLPSAERAAAGATDSPRAC